jgi:long-chain acyl-CoA synthetase
MSRQAASLKTYPYEQARLAELNTEGFGNLVQLFEKSCADYAERPAFTATGQTLTFAEIEQHSRAVAAWLCSATDLQPGDRVAIQLPNLVQYPVVAWGVLRAGLVLVNTNPLYTELELLHQFKDAGVKAVFCLAELLPVLEQVVPQTDIGLLVVTNIFDLIEAQPAPESTLPSVISLPQVLQEGAMINAKMELAPQKTTINEMAMLQYTGGTTGVARGAILTHGNILASALQSGALIETDPAQPEVVIAPMPLYHIYGFTMNIVGTFAAGGHSVLVLDPRDIGGMIATMKSYPFTALAGVNTLFSGLLQHPEFDSVDFSRLKGAIAGGAALVEEIAEEWLQRTGSEIFEGYGLSETASALACNSEDHRRLGTVGRPLPAMQVKIVDEAGYSVPDGEEGELLVRGPQVMHGYWQRPEATAEALDNVGWFRTGDIAAIQPGGFIKICGRLKDMILVSLANS